LVHTPSGNRWNSHKINNREGEVIVDRNGTPVKIVKYTNANDIIIEFQDKNKYQQKTRYDCFLSKRLNNPYYPIIYGIGYLGNGKYVCGENYKVNHSYRVWSDMIGRCYNSSKMYYYCYGGEGVKVCEEWHNYQNFAKWWEENYYQIENEKMVLDKDWINPKLKLYSPENCVIVPEYVNLLIIKNNKKSKLPNGVSYRKSGRGLKRYVANIKCMDIKKTFYCFTPEEAFEKYKYEKEKHIKEIAEKYKDKIPLKLYTAMYKYKIKPYYGETIKHKHIPIKILTISNKEIKRIRNLMNITQENFSKIIGVCNCSMINWESGKTIPKQDKIKKIIKFCKNNNIKPNISNKIIAMTVKNIQNQ
jgi:DNA-binding transcriptional regulator YiaG